MIKVNKGNRKYLIGIIIMVLIIIAIFSIIFIDYQNKHLKEISRDYFYMDTYINVKVYSNNKKKANKALDEIENIYKTYHNLTDRYNSNELGLYNLNHGNNDIDDKLLEMIKYADSWYEKTGGLLDITIGNVVDVWKKYRDLGSGIPTSEELATANINHDDMIINDKVILNNNVSIDLGAISKGYTTQIVGEYLKSVGLTKFIINAGGNVLVGDYYKQSSDTYKVGIEDPTNNNSLYQIVKVNNKAIVTSGGYQRNYTYNGVTYNHIINPKTLYPANNMQSVTVICDSSSMADALSTTLFLMSVDDGLAFLDNYDAEAIWYLNDGTIVKSKGFSIYE